MWTQSGPAGEWPPNSSAVCEEAVAEGPTGHATRIVAAYVHGSLAHGGYVPSQSDVDVLVDVDGPLTADQRTALMHALDAIAPTRDDASISKS